MPSGPARASHVWPERESLIRLIDREGNHVDVPLIHRQDTMPLFGGMGWLSLQPNHSIAARFRSIMLVPPSSQIPNFRLITGILQPESYCYERTIGYVWMDSSRPSLNVHVQFAIVAAPHRTLSRWFSSSSREDRVGIDESQLDSLFGPMGDISIRIPDNEGMEAAAESRNQPVQQDEESDDIRRVLADIFDEPYRRLETFDTHTYAPITPFSINVENENTIITPEMYQAWEDEVMYVAGVSDRRALNQLNWSSFIDHLPSIELSIYSSNTMNEVATRIILHPSDFIVVREVGAYVKLLPQDSNRNRLSLGRNVLRYTTLFLDYANSRLGFCEPI